MNTKKLRFVLSLAFVLTLLGGVIPAAVGGQPPPGEASPLAKVAVVSAGPFLPEQAENRNRAPLDQEGGIFPGSRYIFHLEGLPVYPSEDEATPFYIDAVYPYPYQTLYKILGAADGFPPGKYISSCAHQAAQHTVHCVGEIPAGDPSQPIDFGDIDFFFVLEGTCSLYTDHQNTITIKLLTNLSIGLPTDEVVEPILDLTAVADSPAEGAKEVFIESGHQGPLLKWHDQSAGYVCGDGSNPYTQDIAYAVDIQKQGASARRVGDQQGNCARQVQLSQADLSCLDNGDPAPWTWTVSAVDLKYSPCVDPLLNSAAAGFLNFALARSPQGHLALIWQAAHQNFVDLAYTVYDANVHQWGADQYLSNDEAVEAAFSPAFANDGTLYLAYRKSQTDYITRSVQLSSTLSITVSNLPAQGRSDLYVLSNTVGRNLKVSNFSITPTIPAPGAPFTLQAQVENTGDLQAGPVKVRFSDGSTPLITVTVAPTITAGAVITATLGLLPTRCTLATPAAVRQRLPLRLRCGPATPSAAR